MLWHPLALTVAILDIATLFFLAWSVASSLRTTASWSPDSSGREQIRLETAYETGAIAARAAFALTTAATAVLVVAITNVFQSLIPGAMCGTGVLKAMGGHGTRMFAFRIAALVLFCFWVILEKLNRRRPDFPLARTNASVLLLVAPLLFLAVYETLAGIGGLDVHSPVDCCAAVYDRFVNGGETSVTAGTEGSALVAVFGGLTFLLIGSGSAGLFGTSARFCTAAASVLSLLWVPVSALTVVRVFAAYHYQVLQHHCPWCLFLKEHLFVGFPLFFFLGMAFVEALLLYPLYLISRRHAELRAEALGRVKRGQVVMVLSALLFAALAVTPALLWRLRFGVWMGG